MPSRERQQSPIRWKERPEQLAKLDVPLLQLPAYTVKNIVRFLDPPSLVQLAKSHAILKNMVRGAEKHWSVVYLASRSSSLMCIDHNCFDDPADTELLFSNAKIDKLKRDELARHLRPLRGEPLLPQTNFSWPPFRPCWLLRWPNVTIMLDCALDYPSLGNVFHHVHGERVFPLSPYRHGNNNQIHRNNPIEWTKFYTTEHLEKAIDLVTVVFFRETIFDITGRRFGPFCPIPDSDVTLLLDPSSLANILPESSRESLHLKKLGNYCEDVPCLKAVPGRSGSFVDVPRKLHPSSFDVTGQRLGPFCPLPDSDVTLLLDPSSLANISPESNRESGALKQLGNKDDSALSLDAVFSQLGATVDVLRNGHPFSVAGVRIDTEKLMEPPTEDPDLPALSWPACVEGTDQGRLDCAIPLYLTLMATNGREGIEWEWKIAMAMGPYNKKSSKMGKTDNLRVFDGQRYAAIRVSSEDLIIDIDDFELFAKTDVLIWELLSPLPTDLPERLGITKISLAQFQDLPAYVIHLPVFIRGVASGILPRLLSSQLENVAFGAVWATSKEFLSNLIALWRGGRRPFERFVIIVRDAPDLGQLQEFLRDDCRAVRLVAATPIWWVPPEAGPFDSPLLMTFHSPIIRLFFLSAPQPFYYRHTTPQRPHFR
ncbi:unnamed protein product, partial [Mesorhabditis spiculigera]